MNFVTNYIKVCERTRELEMLYYLLASQGNLCCHHGIGIIILTSETFAICFEFIPFTHAKNLKRATFKTSVTAIFWIISRNKCTNIE